MSAFSRPVRSRYLGRKAIILFFMIAPLFFVASLSLTLPYQQGDQFFYRALYEYLGDADFSEIPFAQIRFTGSAEPLYGILMWLGSNAGIDKDIFIAFVNTFFCLAVFNLLLRRSANFLFVVLLFSNYYFLVLLTSAERLKFSYIILVLAITSSSKIIATFFVLVSPLFHFQSLLTLVASFTGYASHIRMFRIVKIRSILIFTLLSSIFFGCAILFIRMFYSDLKNKLMAYSGSGNVFDMAGIALLIIVAFFVFSRKMESFLFLSTCAGFAYFLGSGRVNMIATMIFIHLVIIAERTKHPLVLVLMTYFSFKSVGYVLRIYSTGSGF